jgi:adenosylcobinamide-phosphate synthase
MLIGIFLILLFGGTAYFLLNYIKEFNTIVYIIIASYLLKTTFCVRYSYHLSNMVACFLKRKENDPNKAPKSIRFLLSTVERKPNDSKEPPVASSTIRSLFENGSDFFVAPVFYYLFFGIPGALAYRVANILDGMIGHRGEYEYYGKFVAYLDQITNFIPARLTALLTVISAGISRHGSAPKTWAVARRDHNKTDSLNAGWPMAAAAGALEVELERAGHYTLGISDKPLNADTIYRATSLFATLVILFSLISMLILYFITLI